MRNRISMLTGVAMLLTLSVGSPLAAAGESQTKTRKLTPPQNAKDMHIQIAGQITGVSGIDPAPSDTSTSGGDFGCAWPNGFNGTDSFDINVKRSGGGNWNFRLWWTYDGTLPKPDRAPDLTFASLFVGSGGIYDGMVYAENSLGTSPVQITNATATIVNNLNLFNSPNWDQASGITIPIADTVLAPGANQVPVGLASFNASQWLKITADLDGDTFVFGYSQVPEPASIALLGGGLIISILRRR